MSVSALPPVPASGTRRMSRFQGHFTEEGRQHYYTARREGIGSRASETGFVVKILLFFYNS